MPASEMRASGPREGKKGESGKGAGTDAFGWAVAEYSRGRCSGQQRRGRAVAPSSSCSPACLLCLPAHPGRERADREDRSGERELPTRSTVEKGEGSPVTKGCTRCR